MIEDDGGVAIAVATDVTLRSSMEALMKRTESTLGAIDILVNNAGVMFFTFMKNFHWDEWEKQVDVNCKGFSSFSFERNLLFSCGHATL